MQRIILSGAPDLCGSYLGRAPLFWRLDVSLAPLTAVAAVFLGGPRPCPARTHAHSLILSWAAVPRRAHGACPPGFRNDSPRVDGLPHLRQPGWFLLGTFSVWCVFLSLVAHKIPPPELGLLVFNLQPLLELSLFLFNCASFFYGSFLLNFYDNIETWIDSNKNEIFME